MDERISFAVYFFGTIFTGAGIANLMTGLIVSGTAPIHDDVLSGIIVTLVGLVVMIAGILLLNKVSKEASVYSMLIILCLMLAMFIVKTFTNAELQSEFLIATTATATVVVALHIISRKIGIYEAMKQIYPWNRNNGNS